MERQKKIIDASVIVKWFLNEKDSDKALKIREDHILGKITLIVPELMFLEVTNALRYKKLDQDKLSYTNKSLWKYQFKIQNLNEDLLKKATSIAIKYNITIYDSLYIALAQTHKTSMITADKALYKIPNVIALEKI